VISVIRSQRVAALNHAGTSRADQSFYRERGARKLHGDLSSFKILGNDYTKISIMLLKWTSTFESCDTRLKSAGSASSDKKSWCSARSLAFAAMAQTGI